MADTASERGYCTPCGMVRTIVRAGQGGMCMTCRSGRIVALTQLPADHPAREGDNAGADTYT